MSLNTVTLEFENKLRTLRSANGSTSSSTNETIPETKPLENKPLSLGENIPYADESPERPIIPTRSKPLRNIQRNEMSSTSSTTTSSSTPPNSPAEFLLSPRTLRHHDIDDTLRSPPTKPYYHQSPSKSLKSSPLPQTSSQIISSSQTSSIQLKSPITPSGTSSSDETDGSTTSNPRDNPPTNTKSITTPNTQQQPQQSTSKSMRINPDVLREILTEILENKDKTKSIKTKLNRSLSLNYKNHRDDCSCNISNHQISRHATNSSSNSTSNRFSLTKDEKTDKNISKKRQLQDMRNYRHRHTAGGGNRSIKRRHTVGGTHDYVTKIGSDTGAVGGGTPCPGYISSDISSPEWLSRKREMKSSHLEQENCRY